MIEQLANRGFGYGTGLLSPDCSKFIVSMPKNASSFVKGVLIGARGHWHHSETLVNGQENLVVLRDPIDRWCSGIVQ